MPGSSRDWDGHSFVRMIERYLRCIQYYARDLDGRQAPRPSRATRPIGSLHGQPARAGRRVESGERAWVLAMLGHRPPVLVYIGTHT